MKSSYDVYMCRYEQLINDAKTLIGKPINLIHSSKYKKTFDELGALGCRVLIAHDGGNIINRKCIDVIINLKKGA